MATLSQGLDELFQGPDVLLHGEGGTPLREVPDHCILLYTLYFEESDGAIVRMWTGRGRLFHDGEWWDNVPYHLFSVNDIEAQAGVDDRNRLGINMIVPSKATGQVGGLKMVGKVDVTVRPVYSVDGGETWHWVQQQVRGVMSSVELTPAGGGSGQPSSAKLWRFEISTPDSDIDRGNVEYFDTETQSRLYGEGADLGFEHIPVLGQGYTLGLWPIIVSVSDD